MRNYVGTLLTGFALVVLLLLIAPTTLTAQECKPTTPITLVSAAPDGTAGNDASARAELSSNGRYVTFSSYASNLVADDNNDTNDIFVYDRLTKQIVRVSVGLNGTESNGQSEDPNISGDGRYITFWSNANNLAADDFDIWDVFVYDQQTGQTKRISTPLNDDPAYIESQYPNISGDGRYIAFWSEMIFVPEDTNDKLDIYVYDQQTAGMLYIPIGQNINSVSAWHERPALSWDGKLIAFASNVANLVTGDTNNVTDVFVYNRETAQITRVSVGLGGVQGNKQSYYPNLSADGRYVTFVSNASNFVNDTNGYSDAFVHDRKTGRTTRVSVSSSGTQTNNHSYFPQISGDGRYITFSSYASNLVPGDTNSCYLGNCSDIFVYDQQTGETVRVSVAADGTQSDGDTGAPSISHDGNYLVFVGWQVTNLTPNASGGQDVFLAPALDVLASVPQRNCFTGDITLTWNPITWAASYHIQVARDTAFRDLLVNTTTAQTEWPLSGLEPRVYYWRVQAIRANNSAGGWSAVESFTVGWE